MTRSRAPQLWRVMVGASGYLIVNQSIKIWFYRKYWHFAAISPEHSSFAFLIEQVNQALTVRLKKGNTGAFQIKMINTTFRDSYVVLTFLSGWFLCSIWYLVENPSWLYEFFSNLLSWGSFLKSFSDPSGWFYFIGLLLFPVLHMIFLFRPPSDRLQISSEGDG